MQANSPGNGQLFRRSSSLTSELPTYMGRSRARGSSDSRNSHRTSGRWKRFMWLPSAALSLLFIIVIGASAYRGTLDNLHPKAPVAKHIQEQIMVSYSYFEKDAIQLANAEFFLSTGMGIASTSPAPTNTDFVIVVNGEKCGPCEKLKPLLGPDSLNGGFPQTVANAMARPGLTLLWRTENEGMDFAAHNVTMEWLKAKGSYSNYKFFIFLNSSVRGPFVPSYMPEGWQWTRAYTDRLSESIKGVSSSIVCLPDVDAGGPGPKMESWAFALDREGLDLAVFRGVFWLRKCKLCTDDDGIVVMGEYGLSKALLEAGYNIATLMSRYQQDIDWKDPRHWSCNDQVHPSRHGTYDHISMHPFETVFLKASWDVGQPHLEKYTSWFDAHAKGEAGTSGQFDESMYRYAISMEAQAPNSALECFKVPRRIEIE